MKKRVFILLCLSLFLTACAKTPPEPASSGKVKIVATLFPQYDFAREIAGEKAEITLLLPPGVESHSFEPSPADLKTIAGCDLFLYTGDAMEPWAKNILASAKASSRAVDLSDGIKLLPPLAAAGTPPAELHEHEHDEDDGHEHDEHGLDPHIWTDPQNASIMASSIADALMDADPQNAQHYRENLRAYQKKLSDLDSSFASAVAAGRHKILAFGGRFALTYFFERYGLSYVGAYSSCSHDMEPSAADATRVVDEMISRGMKILYYEELSSPKVAETIAAETGAKLLLFHSAHNLSKDELARGEGYLSLMEQNLLNLKEGLDS